MGSLSLGNTHTHTLDTLAQLYTSMEFLHLRTEYAAGSQLDFVMKQAFLIVIPLPVYLKPKISEKFSPSPVVKVMYSCGVSVCIPAQ